jgi:hypothetical protein
VKVCRINLPTLPVSAKVVGFGYHSSTITLESGEVSQQVEWKVKWSNLGNHILDESSAMEDDSSGVIVILMTHGSIYAPMLLMEGVASCAL